MDQALGGGVMRARAASIALALALGLVACVACKGSKRSGGEGNEPAQADGPTIVLKDSSEGLLLTWIDAKGDFHIEERPEGVPLAGRDAVRVVDPSREERTDLVQVADMRVPGPDGTYPVKLMSRTDFEKLAVERRAKTGPTLVNAGPSGSPSGEAQAAADPRMAARPAVIIYGADWCTACHDAAAYLRRRGVTFVEKNIEKDAEAAREMHQKLTKSGLRGGSIPVLDVRGRVMIGFNPRSVDDALGKPI